MNRESRGLLLSERIFRSLCIALGIPTHKIDLWENEGTLLPPAAFIPVARVGVRWSAP